MFLRRNILIIPKLSLLLLLIRNTGLHCLLSGISDYQNDEDLNRKVLGKKDLGN